MKFLSHISHIFQDKNANFLKLNLQNKKKWDCSEQFLWILFFYNL